MWHNNVLSCVYIYIYIFIYGCMCMHLCVCVCGWRSESKRIFIFSIFGLHQNIWVWCKLHLRRLLTKIDQEICHVNIHEDPRLEVGVEKDQDNLVSEERDSGRGGSWAVRMATLADKHHTKGIDQWCVSIFELSGVLHSSCDSRKHTEY